MIPVARTKQLLTQEVGSDLVVYDQTNNASHCLMPVAANVWHHCNGQNTIEDIADLIEQALKLSTDSGTDVRGLVYLAIDELERFGLIDGYLQKPQAVSTISRRKVIKTSVLAGGFSAGIMFPLIKSIVAPEPASATSSILSTGKAFTCSCGTEPYVKTITKQCPATSASPVCDCTMPSRPKITC